MNEIWSTKLRRELHVLQPSFIEQVFQMTVYQSNTDNDAVRQMERLEIDMEEVIDTFTHTLSKKEKIKKEQYLMKLTANVLSYSDATALAHMLVSVYGDLLLQRLGITDKKNNLFHWQ